MSRWMILADCICIIALLVNNFILNMKIQELEETILEMERERIRTDCPWK